MGGVLPREEVRYMIEQLLLWGGIWFYPETYQKLPVLLPYAVRDAVCREKDPITGKDTRGAANSKGYIPDDNSSCIPSLTQLAKAMNEYDKKTLESWIKANMG